MKKILIYGFYLLGAAALLAGCIKDEVADPAPVSGEKLTLQMPDAQEVAITRAATEMECKISSMYLLVYRSNSLVHKQLIASASVTGNGTAQPSVDLDYKVRAGDKVYVVANYSASIGTSLQELGTGTSENVLSALLVYNNPIYRRLSPSAEIQPLYGSATWSAGSNVCTLVRSRARVSVTLGDSGLFSGKTLTYILAGAPEKTSMEVVYNTTTQKYEIPNVDGLGGTWNTEADVDNIIPLTYAIYCAPYPISMDAGGVSVDKNTFDKRRTSLILCATDASDVKEYYRLDFSKQLTSTTILGDASNEYLDIDPNTHYAFRIESVKSGGYTTAAEAWKNPGSNIEYTVSISGDGWKSSTSNGQYLVRTERDTVFVLKNMAMPMDLTRFACQLPDAGQKPGGELPGSIDTRVVSLVKADKTTTIPVENIQLCKSDGTPVANNTFDFSGEMIPAEGYQLKYVSGTDLPLGLTYLKICYGNVEHYIPIANTMFYAGINTVKFTYEGKVDNTLQVQSYYIVSGTGSYIACPWTAEFSIDGGVSWMASPPDMIPEFPVRKSGFKPGNPDEFPSDFKFDVTAQPIATGNSHNMELRARQDVSGVYDLSTKGGRTAMNTANCYLVGAPGSYTFPLVYGNGVKDGAPNPDAYTFASGTNILESFVNYQDAPINDPYIYNDSNIQLKDACLVWQDEQNLVDNIELAGDGKSISFDVDRSSIRQGNAIIAVRDMSGEIVWSWHIWVTDYALDSDLRTISNYQNKEYTLMPVNVGWCDPEVLTSEARSVMVRITQDKTGMSRTFTLDQAAYLSNVPGNNPYFQWGRKDPMRAGIGSSKEKPIYTDIPEYAFDRYGTGKVSIGTTIQNPYVFYNHGGSEETSKDWCSTLYFNLWGVTNTMVTHTVGVKTIYDPSPVGYLLPPAGFASGFTATGNNTTLLSDFNVEGDYSNIGWNFYGEKGKKGSLVFFPGTGYRTNVTGPLGGWGQGYYWTATTHSYIASGASQALLFRTDMLAPANSSNRGGAQSVRAIKE